ncbi:glutamate-rich protein 6B isoform X2 [Sarcophilus harrisii]|uniref:glutamate-rich protein 6B isoform X2 n=1 Tax=Sarcophilus harrisii TaxID=9305 RepID=UPI001301DE60|nr:glutamate-rich protein 6B isoform X2 [Sarcophilus harrisii]
MSEKKFLPINVHPSSHKLIFSSPTSSMENVSDKEYKKLLPEISVTKEEKEKSRTEKSRKLEFLTNDQVIPSQSSSSASSSPNVFTLPSLSFPPMKSTNLPLKTSSMPAFISFKAEEEDYKEKLKSVMKVTSGLALPSTSSFIGDSSTSFLSVPVPVSVPSSQFGTTPLETKTSTSISCSTQTEWLSDDSEKDLMDNIKLTPIIRGKKRKRKKKRSTSTQIQSEVYKGAVSSSPFPQPSRSYQTIFKHVVQELLDKENKAVLETDVSYLAELKEETRRKLAFMFKTNFEKYKDVFRQILKRRGSANIKKDVKTTKEYHITYTPEESLSSVSTLVELDEEWVKDVTKVHRGFGVPTFYKGPPGTDCLSKQFSIFFPDGTGQIYYPSGNIAIVICDSEDTDSFIYLIFKDEQQLRLQGIVNNLGHATFYNKDNNIWVCLDLDMGFYFDKNGKQKVWNWWDPNHHFHAPPNQSISFKLNPCVSVDIKSQDKVFITFSYHKQSLSLNLGTKIKAKDSYSEKKLQKQPILGTYKVEKAFQVIKSLLKKMRGLSCKTKVDLENFVKGSSPMSPVENHLRAGKLSAVLASFGRIRTE